MTDDMANFTRRHQLRYKQIREEAMDDCQSPVHVELVTSSLAIAAIEYQKYPGKTLAKFLEAAEAAYIGAT